MQKLKRIMSMMLALIICCFCATDAQAAVKGVRAYSYTVPSKLIQVTSGNYRVTVPKCTGKEKASTLKQVMFKAAKTGTYRFLFSDIKSSSLTNPIATMQLKYVKKTSTNSYKATPLKIETGSGTFTKVHMYAQSYQDAYYEYLIGRKEDSGQDVDETECWEAMVTEMEGRMKNGVCTEFFVDLELKKGDIIYICSNNCGEYSYKGNTDTIKKAYSYALTVKKV